ncbi:Radical SAM superfamily enzyme YgiQ, UPF0313 family [Desulfonispora thiosulfatigenes DSM 11270]|uniref:Radical SAM superfamily enzyme YgiQ, UPF0313 family n=1 Tax=Desulfonispora thiosulfatigenes DSM 11270 TaxID=656914 RepID=A0A1W1UFE4_DESTI|nr:B12-binding domain-containing radical SAM protein [Desulfonispora thiosulfatigenes]SMB79753.1 Radical SAM superfamily enzyme YgiQ, UPF0313 family [Desulfonispora thiosulfatigenes DSM 11270]
MKILLTTLNTKYVHSSLALRYLEKYCKDYFSNIAIREYTINQGSDYILGEIYKGNYNVVCFSCYIWNITSILDLVADLKRVNPKLLIILGGPEVSFDPIELMEQHQAIDYVVIGEGEVTFLELLHYLQTGQGDRASIHGLSYREDNQVKVTKPRSLITDLGQVPFPYDEDLTELDNKIVYYESSRGCPYNCSYCLSSTSHGVRFFPLERVKKDLKFFLEAKVDQVKFVDRTFNVIKSHSLEIMRFIHNNDNGHTNFHFEVTADLLDEETLNFLANVRIGLFQFEIGVQSTNPDTLKSINRTVNWEKLKYVVERLSRNKNIHLHLDLIAGLPYEDFTSFKNSFNDVYSLEPGKLQLGFLKLLKGTSLRNDSEVYGYQHKMLPPYEVLANNYLDFHEILRLKAIEEMLELYYNSNDFTYSIRYILSNFYLKPAEFYQELSEYWEEKGYHHMAHTKSKLYAVLLDFYHEKNYPINDVFAEILKFDFLTNNKNPLPSFLPELEHEDFKNIRYNFLKDNENVTKYLPEHVGQPAKTILKNVRFELFRYDVLKIIANLTDKNIMKKPTVILFDYSNKNPITNEYHFSRLSLPGLF